MQKKITADLYPNHRIDLYLWFKYDLGRKFYAPQIQFNPTGIGTHDL